MTVGITPAQTAKAYEYMHRLQQAGEVNLVGMDAGRFNSLFEKAVKLTSKEVVSDIIYAQPQAAATSTALAIRPTTELAVINAAPEAKGILGTIKETATKAKDTLIKYGKKGIELAGKHPIAAGVAAAGVLLLGGKIVYDKVKEKNAEQTAAQTTTQAYVPVSYAA